MLMNPLGIHKLLRSPIVHDLSHSAEDHDMDLLLMWELHALDFNAVLRGTDFPCV